MATTITSQRFIYVKSLTCGGNITTTDDDVHFGCVSGCMMEVLTVVVTDDDVTLLLSGNSVPALFPGRKQERYSRYKNLPGRILIDFGAFKVNNVDISEFRTKKS